MMPKFVIRSASLLLFVAAASGCNVTVTSDTCTADSAVLCGGGTTGYSCTGNAVPNLACSDGIVDGDLTDFCCDTGAVVIPADCKYDTSVVGCGYGSFGFSCSGGGNPEDTDPSLTCSQPVSSGADLLYCCESGTVASGSCTGDSSLGCYGGSSGLVCTGNAVPDAAQNCSNPEIGPSGETLYCCGGTVGTCGADASVTGCGGGSAGYSCNGSATPDPSSLWCSEGIAATGGFTWYCCVPTPTVTTTCVQDTNVSCPTPGSFGFACSGTDTPADADATLTCSAGIAGDAGNTLYCCQ
jgi:hypothetical protein